MSEIKLRSPEEEAIIAAALRDALITVHASEAVRRVQSGQAAAHTLELAGWQNWLKQVGPHTFTQPFASFHSELWNWYWAITEKRRMGCSLSGDERVFLAIWARSFGKSSHLEWAAIAEGALLGRGYVLYISGTQDLAEAHVNSIRERIEGEDVTRYYPHLGKPKVGKHGNQFGWRQDFLMTSGGWAIRPIGLDVGVRGGKIGDLRPTMIILDDVDDHQDSPYIISQKEGIIGRAILPAGTKNTIILFGQNLIHKNSVATRMVENQSGLLSKRILSGPYPAFRDLAIEHQQTIHGPRSMIVGGTPTWPDMSIEACQTFLDNSSEEMFMAEYQHDFAATDQNRVIPEYDESIHVITWKDFERVMKSKGIPSHWQRGVGLDVGYTKGHISAWTWITKSAMNSRLPSILFRYRGLTFVGESIDEQARECLRQMDCLDTQTKEIVSELKHIQFQAMSHEKLGERMVLNTKYGFRFQSCNARKDSGISQWRHFLRVDKSKPHPFHDDVQGSDGKWLKGCPAWFDVVANDQREWAKDDRGLKTHREQTKEWRYRPTPLHEAGMVKEEPMKAADDSCDSTRYILAMTGWGPMSTPLTRAEEIFSTLPEPWADHVIEERAAAGENVSNTTMARDAWYRNQLQMFPDTIAPTSNAATRQGWKQ